MSKRDQVLAELGQLPERLLDDVLTFVRRLKTKKADTPLAVTFASESALGRDWLRPEEDAAWQHL